MLEYNMVDENTLCDNYFNDIFCATLTDDHISVLCPTSYEVEPYDASGSIKYKRRTQPKSLNTINHLAIPKEHTCSTLYMFLDSDYSYVNGTNYDVLSNNDIKVSEYSKFIKTDADGNVFTHFSNIPALRSDKVRLYFVNGYDFSNIYGIFMRVSLKQDVAADKFVDLCNFAVTRNNAYTLVSYLTSPIILGNDVYDRYIEISLPAIYDLMYHENSDSVHELYRYLNIKRDQTLKLQFSYFMDDDVTIKDIDIPLDVLLRSDLPTRPVNCSFTKDSTLKGTIPVKAINSDNLGVYIAECPDLPYIEFYGTWKDAPLTREIVLKFNKSIMLYDTNLVKKPMQYEVSEYYTPEYDIKKWIAMHEIQCIFYSADTVIKTEKYNMSQVFVDDSDPIKFYYRPLIFDEKLGMDVDMIQIAYTLRFVNAEDKVQFVKMGTLCLYEDVAKYYAKGSNLKIGDTKPFKVYNKIVENAQNVQTQKQRNVTPQTKYVKVYYNSTDITLYDNDTNYVPYTYTLSMSQVPKVYKFVFKRLTTGGKYSYVDLTNGYYKLVFRDSGGNTIMIDPTYSTNMNMYLGELEFEINSSNVNKLMSVNEGDRKMSIVSYGDNGYMSSMYDFMYTI